MQNTKSTRYSFPNFLKIVTLSIVVVVTGCSDSKQSEEVAAAEQPVTADEATTTTNEGTAASSEAPSPTRFSGQSLKMPAEILVANPEANAKRNAYFGDLHVHTTYSFDAFAFGTLATPYDAYRYAKGGTIRHPGGFDMKLREPLDFYSVTDHAMFLGVMSGLQIQRRTFQN